MTEDMIREHKALIDQMSHHQMARLWRFAPVGHPYFQPPLSDYFTERFMALGGMTPAISKNLGW